MKSRLFLLLLVLLAVFQAAYYYPRMPPVMASHFDGSGAPNGYQTREAFLGLSAFVLAILVFAFGGLPKLLRRLPRSWINMPHKDYWLAPGRRERSLARMSEALTWFGVATLAMFVSVLELAYRANLSADPRLHSGIWLILGVYALWVVFWMIRFYRSFRRPA